MEVVLLLISISLLVLYIKEMRRVAELEREKQSLAIRFGLAAEQLSPFIKKFNPERFRFIGSPVDGIHFGEKEITFVEFKTGNSQLNENEKRIKELVEKKKVRFEVIRIGG